MNVSNVFGFDRATFNQGYNAQFNFLLVPEKQPTLTARGPGGVAYEIEMQNDETDFRFFNHHPQDGRVNEANICQTLSAKIDNQTDLPLVQKEYVVRRLTPVECERLQGFPDDWTQIEWKGKPKEKCPDAPRYKAIGNSWAVPCVRWIGKRIEAELEKSE